MVLTDPCASFPFFLNQRTLLSSRILYPSDTRQALNSLGSRRLLRFLSKWKKDLRNSSICSLLMPFESLVRIFKEIIYVHVYYIIIYFFNIAKHWIIFPPFIKNSPFFSECFAAGCASDTNESVGKIPESE